jgi:heme/copper-type cytochrome/quinol oxidase subunit 4
MHSLKHSWESHVFLLQWTAFSFVLTIAFIQVFVWLLWFLCIGCLWPLALNLSSWLCSIW